MELQSFDIGENDAIIFVNHGVGLATKLSLPKTVCNYFITADTTRMIEISAHRVDALKLCKTIFAPFNLCHLKDTSLLSSIDVILQPEVIVNFRLGLEMRNLGVESMSALEMRPRAKGFGSLLFSVQLALFLGGRKIYLWGVDHGEVVGKRYFDDQVSVRMDTPFNKIESELQLVSARLAKQGVEILNGPKALGD